MGGCCESRPSQMQGQHQWDTTPAILLPKRPIAKGNYSDSNISEIQQQNVLKPYKKQSRNNPNIDPYKNVKISEKHENNELVLKLLQTFDINQFNDEPHPLDEIEKTRGEYLQNIQDIDTYDISTQINLQKVTNKYENMKQKLELQGVQEFIDADFPHTKDSISKYIEGQLPDADKYQWVKAQHCIDLPNDQEMAVFTSGVSPNDIKQGQLGDCYFLCGLSALAERPGLIKRLFKTKDIDEHGLYAVWLCIDGEWQEILLDDYFPCYNNRPVFSNSVGEELWVLLMEKAYAKVYGGYDKIQAGLTGEAIRDLTGAPTKWIPTEKGADAVWEFIHYHDDIGHIMTAGSQQQAENMTVVEGRKEQDMGIGIVSGHAYAILDHRIVYTPQEVRLVQLRNPWGFKEWTGDWSDKSPLWTPDLREQLGVNDEDDGIFWMDVKDLCSQFSEVTTNMLHENGDDDRYVYNSMKIHFPPDKKRALVKFICHEQDTQGYIQISQKDQRFFACEPYKNYQYSLVQLFVCKSDFSGYIGDICLEDRDMFVQNQFDSTTYYAFIEVDWSENNYDSDYVTISSYASNQIVFKDYQIINNDDNVILDKILSCKPPQNPQKVHKYQDYQILRYNNQAGAYIYFNYHNFTDNVTLVESVKLNNRQYLDIQFPFTDSDNFRVELKPQEAKVVKYKIDYSQGYGSYSYGINFQTELQLDDNDLVRQIKALPRSVDQRKLNDELLPIWVYSYFHSNGLALYYENQSDLTYFERLTIQLTNLDFEDMQDKAYDEGNPFANNVEIILNPGVSRLIKFKVVNPDQGVAFGSSCSFQIK